MMEKNSPKLLYDIRYIYLIQMINKQIYLTHIRDPNIYNHWVKVDLGVMVNEVVIPYFLELQNWSLTAEYIPKI